MPVSSQSWVVKYIFTQILPKKVFSEGLHNSVLQMMVIAPWGDDGNQAFGIEDDLRSLILIMMTKNQMTMMSNLLVKSGICRASQSGV